MNRTWIALDAEIVAQLRDVSENAWHIEQVESSDLSAKEIILIGYGSEPKDSAMGLLSRGLEATRISYVDLQKGDDLYQRIGAPKHLFWDDVVPVSQIEDEDFETYPSGIPFLDKNLQWRWRLPELVVMCGPYGCGKSTIGQILAANFVHEQQTGRQLETGAMLCSWEDLASEVKRNMSAFAKARNAPDIMDRMHFVRRRSSEDRLVSWYMDLVRYHRSRYGTRFFFLDPWNEMDHQIEAGKRETDYVKDIMRAFRDLVDDLQIIVVIATHIPGKFLKGDGGVEPFRIGHAFGSSNFGNKADRGICVARTKAYDKTYGHAIIRHDKSKVERKMGKKGTVAARLNTERFELEYDGFATSEAQDIWRD